MRLMLILEEPQKNENNNIPMAISDIYNGYSLRLADNWSLDISASQEAQPWLEKLASIMELGNDERSCYRKLTFVRSYLPPASPPETSEQQCLLGDRRKADFMGSVRLLSRPDDANLIYDLGEIGDEETEYNKMWQALYPLYLHAMDSGGLPMHAALVELDSKGYAIAAPGGTGKSTCTRRIPLPWRALCDDEVLVVRDVTGVYHAHPFPTWKEYLYYKSNKTWNVQHHVPLRGIFFLMQSEVDEVEPIGQGKATTFIYRSSSQVFYKSWQRMNPDTRSSLRIQAFENASRMAEAIPAFLMKASLTGSFWEKMDGALKGVSP
jgi:SynChlorMet cassette protein ScmC